MIFFMCASHLHQTLDSPLVKLPVAEHASIPEEAIGRRFITVRSDGSVLLSGQTITLDQLRVQITRAREEVPGLKIFLRGDANTKHKMIRDVMLVCAEVGVSEVIFAAWQSEGGL
jgi:biopolymer transport protein ExbD